ncbi:MAG: Citrate synthase [Candidatus Curtissbacteria bacterium GW2011_GWA1_40_47]|nr:MAG: Citrate synthase [Candidatus Curtissbacteria bacterium GW2011_GWB1_40_28]KKR61971.1 MAG: Citrate synthase [Microgenomates group bacterium GW2011_GWC1_40_35]KKR66095.1 MAG: Citrate synthase [Candidatus Curtissbacteria bacterium GW2011_GWA1_40_47]
MMPKPYRTSITTHADGSPHVYGYDLTKLAGNTSFAKAIYLILKGQMPDKASEKMFEAMLTIAIDHGVEPPSVVAARNVSSGGSPIQAAVAAGVLALGEFHGGAIEKAMENFKKYQGVGVKIMVDDFNKNGERISGFGHRLYADDPRTQRLLEIAKELGFFGKYVKFALEVEAEISKESKKLPLNIDGCFSVLLLEMGFNPKVANGIFIIARTPGLVAHVVEETLREKPARRLTENDVEYDGPRPRR